MSYQLHVIVSILGCDIARQTIHNNSPDTMPIYCAINAISFLVCYVAQCSVEECHFWGYHMGECHGGLKQSPCEHMRRGERHKVNFTDFGFGRKQIAGCWEEVIKAFSV